MHTEASPVFMDGRVKPDHDGGEAMRLWSQMFRSARPCPCFACA